MRKLRRFKENGFRPRIQGFDADADSEDEVLCEDLGEEEGGSQVTPNSYMSNLPKGSTPTRMFSKLNKQNGTDDDTLALMKMIRNGYMTENLFKDVINSLMKEMLGCDPGQK